MTNALEALQKAVRGYESARDRYREGDADVDGGMVSAAAKGAAEAAAWFLADRRRRRKKENRRRGIGPDDVKRLRIAQRVRPRTP